MPPNDPRRTPAGPPPAGPYGPPPRQPDPRQPPDPRQGPPRSPDPSRTQVDPRGGADPRSQSGARSRSEWEEPPRHRSRPQEDEPRENRSGSHSRRREPEHGDDGPGRPGSTPDRARPARTPRSRHSATVQVLVMTVASLVAVGMLAVQANGQSTQASAAGPGAKPSSTASAGPAPSGSAMPTATVDPLAVPAGSGSGKRIVYSVSGKRVWLIGSDGSTVQRTFAVVPGTVPVPSGSYHVSGRDSGETGSDGTSVQYVVFFDNPTTVNSSTSFAFDAVADITGLPPVPSGHTGAVRPAQADAVAIWYFAPIGTSVVVV
ncbi:MAG TPA: hypothetical protein VGX23_29440 [Actinocrinis sp.]|nr:hypothetical protein [Actinocrinis sp.]